MGYGHLPTQIPCIPASSPLHIQHGFSTFLGLSVGYSGAVSERTGQSSESTASVWLSGRPAWNQAGDEARATQNKNIQSMHFFISFTRIYPRKLTKNIVSLRR